VSAGGDNGYYQDVDRAQVTRRGDAGAGRRADRRGTEGGTIRL